MHDLPDPLTLSEDEWFDHDWPLAELRAQYLDSRFDNHRREHAFYRYWMGWIATNGNERVSRTTLAEILAEKQWPLPAGEILVRLAKANRIDAHDAEWLLTELPAGTWAHDQFSALVLSKEGNIDWAEALSKMLALRADWVVVTIFDRSPPDALARAEQIIQESARPKGARRFLQEALQRSQKKHF